MSSLLLQINLDLQAGAAISMLNTIESSVDKIIGKMQQFSQFFATNPITIIQPQQLGIADDLLNILKEMDKNAMFVNARNIEDIAHKTDILDKMIDQADELKKTVEGTKLLTKALEKQGKLHKQFKDFYDDAEKFGKDFKTQLDGILKGKTTELKLTKSQQKEFDKYVASLETAVKFGGAHLKQLKMSEAEAKAMLKAMGNVTTETTKQVDVWGKVSNAFMGFLALLPTAAVLMSTLRGPTEGIKASLSEMYDMWKKNNQVSNNFLVNANDNGDTLSQTMMKMRNNISSAGGGMSDEFKKLDIQMGENIVTIDQANEALGSVLNSSFKSVAKGSSDAAGELSMYASIIAQSSRSTGIAVGTTTELMLKVGALGVAASKATKSIDKHNDGIKAAAKLNSVLVNATEKYGMSVDEVTHATSLLSKNMNLLKTSFKGNEALLKAGIPTTTQYAVALMAVGKAAKDAGYDSKMAMSAFSSAIEDPMNNIMMLGNAVTGTMSEQLTAFGESAVSAQKEMAGKSLFEQQIIAGVYGKTVDEINAAAEAHKGMQAQYGDLSNAENLLKMNNDLADQAAADAAAKKGQTDANVNLEKSLDGIRIIFGQIANAMQPLINALAWIMNSQVASYIAIITGTIVALGAAIGGGYMLFKFSKALDAVSGSASKVAAGGGGGTGGGGMKAFAEGIKDFINTLGRIKMASAIKAAAGIAIVGLGIAAAVVPIALAATLLPPDKLGQLAVTIAGIVGMSFILSKMTSIGPQAFIGAGFVAAVGGALAVGVALIGIAANLLPPDKMGALGLVVAGLLASMFILSLMGPVGVPALWGAVMLAAVGAALAVGVVSIALAAKVLDPDIADKLGGLAAGIGWLATTAITGPLALVGAAAMAMAAPLLALSIVSLGAATAMFGQGAIDAIIGLASAVSTIPAGAGVALIGMAAGLAAFAAALTGGAIFSFFSGGIVDNAKEMGIAMQALLGPIVALGGVGDQVGRSFVSIADGLKVFVEAINDSSGWFSSFEGKAEKVASAMRKIAEPMKDMGGGGPGAGGSEEIKKSLAVTINPLMDSNKEIIEELREIKKLLAEKSDSDIGKKIDMSVEVLKKIYGEMVLGGGLGATSANGDYSA